MPSEIIVEFLSPLTDKEKKMIYGYKGELIRCKDCKYADWWGPKGREVLDCIHLYVPHVTPEWYCAWGEKREEERLVMPKADGSTIKIDKMDEVEEDG